MKKKTSNKSFSKFTYDDLESLGIIVEEEYLFPNGVQEVAPSDFLQLVLKKNMDKSSRPRKQNLS